MSTVHLHQLNIPLLIVIGMPSGGVVGHPEPGWLMARDYPRLVGKRLLITVKSAVR